ncbi:hypothetical protein HYT51_01965 [Candidatus Woesearchaeota archaeon]|nr:hypothetical protein [Candidatus Woesearchaeota archaeon]
MELGGNIALINFDALEPSKLIVVKKIVGNYAKKIAEKKTFDKLQLTLKGNYTIATIFIANEDRIETEATNKNLFFALTEALNKI